MNYLESQLISRRRRNSIKASAFSKKVTLQMWSMSSRKVRSNSIRRSKMTGKILTNNIFGKLFLNLFIFCCEFSFLRKTKKVQFSLIGPGEIVGVEELFYS